jgi:hypothetical protein
MADKEDLQCSAKDYTNPSETIIDPDAHEFSIRFEITEDDIKYLENQEEKVSQTIRGKLTRKLLPLGFELPGLQKDVDIYFGKSKYETNRTKEIYYGFWVSLSKDLLNKFIDDHTDLIMRVHYKDGNVARHTANFVNAKKDSTDYGFDIPIVGRMIWEIKYIEIYVHTLKFIDKDYKKQDLLNGLTKGFKCEDDLVSIIISELKNNPPSVDKLLEIAHILSTS